MNKKEILNVLDLHGYKYGDSGEQLKVKLTSKLSFIMRFSENKLDSYESEVYRLIWNNRTYKAELTHSLIGMVVFTLLFLVILSLFDDGYWAWVKSQKRPTHPLFPILFAFIYEFVRLYVYHRKLSTLKRRLNLQDKLSIQTE